MKTCQWCNNAFTTKVSYQIYCSVECRNSATKEKIAERYIASRSARRYGKERKCKSCGGKLSAYNDAITCANCLVIPADVNRVLKDLKGFVNGKFKEDK